MVYNRKILTVIYCVFAVYATYRVYRTLRKRFDNRKKFFSTIKHIKYQSRNGSLYILVKALCDWDAAFSTQK